MSVMDIYYAMETTVKFESGKVKNKFTSFLFDTGRFSHVCFEHIFTESKQLCSLFEEIPNIFQSQPHRSEFGVRVKYRFK